MAAATVIRSLYEAFATGDMDRLSTLLGDTHWVEARGGPYGGLYQGFADIGANVFGPIGAEVQDFTAIPDELLEIGEDRVLALGTYRGTTEAGPLAIRFGHLWTVKGGRMSHFEQFTDTHEWRVATGR